MRVIAGKAKRLNLKTVPGQGTRPTTDRIKETLFNMINNDLPDSNFLDLFSGSGGIGIEALSRGARECYFVENNSQAAECIKQNLEFTRLMNDACLIKKDVLSGIREIASKNIVFDFVFMDPPYKMGLEKDVFRELKINKIINKDTLIIVEADKDDDFEYLTEMGFSISREKIYKTNKHVFVHFNQEEL